MLEIAKIISWAERIKSSSWLNALSKLKTIEAPCVTKENDESELLQLNKQKVENDILIGEAIEQFSKIVGSNMLRILEEMNKTGDKIKLIEDEWDEMDQEKANLDIFIEERYFVEYSEEEDSQIITEDEEDQDPWEDYRIYDEELLEEVEEEIQRLYSLNLIHCSTAQKWKNLDDETRVQTFFSLRPRWLLILSYYSKIWVKWKK
ncbi:MAG: hypothetical protein Ta2E_08900 [Mycoplasmoidaceae bacterium]|nr:MAG: hypothetical protein Ta2E_08900 [Mycoplasmoidaceae bacterium]